MTPTEYPSVPGASPSLRHNDRTPLTLPAGSDNRGIRCPCRGRHRRSSAVPPSTASPNASQSRSVSRPKSNETPAAPGPAQQCERHVGRAGVDGDGHARRRRSARAARPRRPPGPPRVGAVAAGGGHPAAQHRGERGLVELEDDARARHPPRHVREVRAEALGERGGQVPAGAGSGNAASPPRSSTAAASVQGPTAWTFSGPVVALGELLQRVQVLAQPRPGRAGCRGPAGRRTASRWARPGRTARPAAPGCGRSCPRPGRGRAVRAGRARLPRAGDGPGRLAGVLAGHRPDAGRGALRGSRRGSSVPGLVSPSVLTPEGYADARSVLAGRRRGRTVRSVISASRGRSSAVSMAVATDSGSIQRAGVVGPCPPAGGPSAAWGSRCGRGRRW